MVSYLFAFEDVVRCDMSANETTIQPGQNL